MNDWLQKESLDAKISSIVDFLGAHQGINGEFRTLRFFKKEAGRYTEETEYEHWHDFGRCAFATANIVYHLHGITHASVAPIIRRGCEFLRKGIENGLVRYVAAYDRPISFPADVDDTCLAMAALKRSGFRPECNAGMILDNTDERGNFYTWLIPRTKHLRNPRNLYWLGRDAVRFSRRMKDSGFSSRLRASIWQEYRESSEPAVAANVLLYLGIDGRTAPFLEHLVRTLEQEDFPLQYYENKLAAYFHAARLYAAGVEPVVVLKDRILAHILGCQKDGGEVLDPFYTALAALIMIYFECWESASLDKAIRYICQHGMHAEGWRPFHYCNDRRGEFNDGGAELTAAFYLEILDRHRRRLYGGG